MKIIKCGKYFFVLLFCFLQFSFSQEKEFYPGVIKYKDNSIDTLFLTYPKFPHDLKIKTKKTPKSKVKTVSSNEIKMFVVSTGEKAYQWEYLDVMEYKKRKNQLVNDKHKFWLLLIYNTQKVKVYNSSQKYIIDKFGELNSASLNSTGNFTIDFYYRKRGEEAAVRVYEYDFENSDLKNYRNVIAYYFSDCPKVIDYVNQKNFDWNKLLKTATFYSHCNP